MKKATIAAIMIAVTPLAVSAADVDLDQIRASVEKYKDINVAMAEGYITPDNLCVSAAAEGLPAELGAMGMHYIHPALLKITGTDPRVNGESTYTDWSQPSVLIYEPQADGSMELVAVENLVFEAAWEALRPLGRLVANAVTLESEVELIALHARYGGDLVKIMTYRAAPVGRLTGWRPAMPVTQWSLVKR